jgi:superfamily II DNA or RNA helicase
VIRRFSSRRERLAESFLKERLTGAKSYDRIAGYFSSSIIEVAGENLDAVKGPIRIVCNSQLDERDIRTAQAAKTSMRREWCESEPEQHDSPIAATRFFRLFEYLKNGRISVRVLPDSAFGLIHGKAGIITKSDGSKTTFMGSANESVHGWLLNYELIWEDDSPEAVQWVQEEFDALWNHPSYQELSDFVIEDIGRLAHRYVIPSVKEWQTHPEPASTIIETPLYRRELGLWEHQKYFINLAFRAHQTRHGARFVLADMVGLGKTLQLAISAQLMALAGDRPVLILAPKTLVCQWQDELQNLLDLPSALWNGKQWIDELGNEYPIIGDEGILKCPRRIGIVPYSIITYGYHRPENTKIPELLKTLQYECIIVDEAHHARRKNLGPTHENETPEPNNLLAYLLEIGGRSKSILLATATPVQMYPIEAYDLLSILASDKNESVLGNKHSLWRREAFRSLHLIAGTEPIPDDPMEIWSWMANPFPPGEEHIDYKIIRKSLKIPDDHAWIPGSAYEDLIPPDQAKVQNLAKDFFLHHNPYIRHIVRRTREFLQQTLNLETNEPYLKPIQVKLFGEDPHDAILLPTYLHDAYDAAQQFCQLLGQRSHGTGFIETLLLRRVGSTLIAGRKTAEGMLGIRSVSDGYEEEEQESAEVSEIFRQMTPEERSLLLRFTTLLKEHEDEDPKFERVRLILEEHEWLERGCIIFSQYYDSISWIAGKLKDIYPNEMIGIYAGGQRSGVIQNGIERRLSREELKARVRRGEIRLLLGTDAASEGLNLQALGSLINLDLPWNPTRLEQRKGRIQRIGQVYDDVWIYNMRYRGSVEDRVHDLLSQRFSNIHAMFGQIPDTLEDVWVQVAMNKIDDARRTIEAVPPKHPFEIRYDNITPINWESCARVLDDIERRKYLLKGW